jgi:UDP:flavonoid glycosyltransferase YjiC (YdhE family)
MAKIAFAWELGGAFGHAMGCASLAQPLHAAGHGIAFVFRELAQLSQLPESRDYAVFQAPRHSRNPDFQPASYSEVLLGIGYAEPEALACLIAAWRSVLSRWGAQMLVADSAPTALLAARTLGVPRVSYGNGFSIPPRADTLPSFRFDEMVDDERLEGADRRVLGNINAALARFGAAPLPRVADVFEVQEQFLCTLPQLDHYGSRAASGYWGPRFRLDYGSYRDWPEGSGKRVFVYLTSACPQLDVLIELLARSNHRVVAYIPNLEAARRNRLAGGRRVVLDRPARLDRLLQGCDLMVTHGGDLAAAGLMAGVAQLCLPMHYEHFITARRIEQLRAGTWLPLQADAATIGSVLERMLASAEFQLAARAFCRHHAAFSGPEQRRRIVARLQELLAPNPPFSQGTITQ